MYVSEHSAAHIFLLKGDEDDLSRPRCQFIPQPLWVVALLSHQPVAAPQFEFLHHVRGVGCDD